uniref:Secreted protein n=1 Tax=Anopheles darlingi TaxID=43151 RepID=A0A2M4DHC6_ANODA
MRTAAAVLLLLLLLLATTAASAGAAAVAATSGVGGSRTRGSTRILFLLRRRLCSSVMTNFGEISMPFWEGRWRRYLVTVVFCLLMLLSISGNNQSTAAAGDIGRLQQ